MVKSETQDLIKLAEVLKNITTTCSEEFFEGENDIDIRDFFDNDKTRSTGGSFSLINIWITKNPIPTYPDPDYPEDPEKHTPKTGDVLPNVFLDMGLSRGALPSLGDVVISSDGMRRGVIQAVNDVETGIVVIKLIDAIRDVMDNKVDIWLLKSASIPIALPIGTGDILPRVNTADPDSMPKIGDFAISISSKGSVGIITESSIVSSTIKVMQIRQAFSYGIDLGNNNPSDGQRVNKFAEVWVTVSKIYPVVGYIETEVKCEKMFNEKNGQSPKIGDIVISYTEITDKDTDSKSPGIPTGIIGRVTDTDGATVSVITVSSVSDINGDIRKFWILKKAEFLISKEKTRVDINLQDDCNENPKLAEIKANDIVVFADSVYGEVKKVTETRDGITIDATMLKNLPVLAVEGTSLFEGGGILGTIPGFADDGAHYVQVWSRDNNGLIGSGFELPYSLCKLAIQTYRRVIKEKLFRLGYESSYSGDLA